jgi:predicted membrane protein
VNLVNNTGVSMNVFGYFNEYGQSMVWGAMKTTVYVLPNTQGLFTPVCVFAFNGSVTGTLVATGVDNEGRTVHCVAGRTGNSGVVGITDGAGVKAPVTITLTLE